MREKGVFQSHTAIALLNKALKTNFRRALTFKILRTSFKSLWSLCINAWRTKSMPNLMFK